MILKKLKEQHDIVCSCMYHVILSIF